MESYITIKQAATAEFIEKRSRFIGTIRPVQSESEAAAFMTAIRAEYRNANHNCYAYIIRGNIQRYSDDGEPQGTAGIPILEILRKENIVDAAIVVTRYFGGVLLGANGLVRAYSHTAKQALAAAEILLMQPCTLFSLELAYPLYDRVNLLLQNTGAVILQSDFNTNINLKLRIPSSSFPEISAQLTELTGGAAIPVVLGEEFA